MDHHCPVLNVCVGWANQKQFMLLILYGSLQTGFAGVTGLVRLVSLRHVLETSEQVGLGVLAGVGLYLSISLLAFAVMQFLLIAANRTYIESLSDSVASKESSPIHLFRSTSRLENVGQVFGSSIVLALLPIPSSPGDGHSYPVYQTPSNV